MRGEVICKAQVRKTYGASRALGGGYRPRLNSCEFSYACVAAP